MDTRRTATLVRRLAELHREKADVLDELAEALMAEDGEGGGQGKRRRVPAGPRLVPPERPVSEVDRARAKRALRGLA